MGSRTAHRWVRLAREDRHEPRRSQGLVGCTRSGNPCDPRSFVGLIVGASMASGHSWSWGGLVELVTEFTVGRLRGHSGRLGVRGGRCHPRRLSWRLRPEAASSRTGLPPVRHKQRDNGTRVQRMRSGAQMITKGNSRGKSLLVRGLPIGSKVKCPTGPRVHARGVRRTAGSAHVFGPLSP